MPEFISKIQHNTYEKGEFSDEKIRSLSETLQLIKDFRFDAERTLTEIQLTGPSVTIQDEYVNYLKVGLYFNGKLCVYYLDNENHLYECYLPNVDAACDLVTDFFNEQLDLSKFEKHLFNIGNQSHFVTKYFEYKVTSIQLFFYFSAVTFLLLVACVGTFSFFMAKTIPLPVIFLYGFLDLLALQAFVFLTRISIKAFNMSLNVSAGQNVFEFGENDNLKKYDKKSIALINIYGQTGRSSRIFNLMEIIFIDESKILIPGILIDPLDFINKFEGYKRHYISGYIDGFKTLWKFTQKIK